MHFVIDSLICVVLALLAGVPRKKKKNFSQGNGIVIDIAAAFLVTKMQMKLNQCISELDLTVNILITFLFQS